MGMFDYIRCEAPLPDGWQPRELQSKDFDCEMTEHIISKEGRLLLERGHNEGRQVPKYEDANFHGVVNFYGNEMIGYEDQQPDLIFKRPIYKLHEYEAKFTDGQLVEIVTPED